MVWTCEEKGQRMLNMELPESRQRGRSQARLFMDVVKEDMQTGIG